MGFGEEQNADDVVLSGPSGFRHESHIGWDPQNGFEIRNIPPEWRKLFQAAGVKKSKLQDGETAKFIMETVAQAALGMEPPPAPAPPPPMVPSTSAAPHAPAPPPPIPSGGHSSSGLLAGLQSAHLKRADDRVLPDLREMDEQQTGNIAVTLQKAMAARRVDMAESDEEIKSDDEWSD